MKFRIAALAATAVLALPALTGCLDGDSDKNCKTTSTAQVFAKPGGGSGGGGKGGGSKGGGSKSKPGSKTKPKNDTNTGVNGGGGTTTRTTCKKDGKK